MRITKHCDSLDTVCGLFQSNVYSLGNTHNQKNRDNQTTLKDYQYKARTTPGFNMKAMTRHFLESRLGVTKNRFTQSQYLVGYLQQRGQILGYVIV